MLSIEDIQPKFLTWLLEKMATIALTEDPQRDTQAVNKPQLILSQIRWLDRIINGAELADKLHEILEASPQSVQQDIIISLPVSCILLVAFRKENLTVSFLCRKLLTTLNIRRLPCTSATCSGKIVNSPTQSWMHSPISL